MEARDEDVIAAKTSHAVSSPAISATCRRSPVRRAVRTVATTPTAATAESATAAPLPAVSDVKIAPSMRAANLSAVAPGLRGEPSPDA